MAMGDESRDHEIRDNANMPRVGLVLAAIVLGLVLLFLFYPHSTSLDGAARAPVTTLAPTNTTPNSPITSPSKQP
jgi:hypothetical protein